MLCAEKKLLGRGFDERERARRRSSHACNLCHV